MSQPQRYGIGFELQNQEAENEGIPPAQDGLYPTINDNDNAASVNQVHPIGFESHLEPQGEDNGGPTDVITESPRSPTEMSKISIEDDSEALLKQAGNNKEPQSEEETAYFRDKKRRIDFVLAYHDGKGEGEAKKVEKRQLFEANLDEVGLDMEREDKSDGKTHFIKIHVPWKVATKYAEIMKMKMPIAENDMGPIGEPLIKCPTPFDVDEEILRPDAEYFTAPFHRDRIEQFVIDDEESFFSSAQRSLIAYEVLKRTVYERAGHKQPKKLGVDKLVTSGVYTAAFPLHEGRYHSEHSILTRGKDNDRHLLYEIWAAPKNWYKFQPVDLVRKYFGEKIGIYFYWLGFYTTMLFPAAVVGIIVFIYGLATLGSDIPSEEICDEAGIGNLTMCPTCDKRCSYWHLWKSCTYSKVTYLFDNPATVFFAAFMALWATFFHEIWQRKEAEIGYDWDVNEFEDEEETVRPEYELSVTNRRINPVNKEEEPFLPIWNKLVRYGTAVLVIMVMICVVLCAVVGVIVYRTVIVIVFYTVHDENIRSQAKMAASITAACINLIIIFILNKIYTWIAKWLTDLEKPRTQTEWEDSFTIKMFLFQFVNYYSSIFYIAFFKGRFTGYPGNFDYSFAGVRGEECDPSGCLIELFIQLCIIMVGKQAMNNFLEIVLPKITVWFRSRQAGKDEDKVYSRYEQDHHLNAVPDLGLFSEYLEMVIQFGFVSIFVAAFPLAPFFAFINNVIEIRLDAYKYTCQFRRPLPLRAQDIGAWFGILKGITAVAVMSNAAIIAFTSEFIPKQVYRYVYSPDETLHGYMNFSLSVFDTADYQNNSLPDPTAPGMENFQNVSMCRFRGYRTGSPDYFYSKVFWHILAARFAFFLIFQNAVVFLTWLIMYLVPDVPGYVKMMMLREAFLAKEALFIADKKAEDEEKKKDN